MPSVPLPEVCSSLSRTFWICLATSAIFYYVLTVVFCEQFLNGKISEDSPVPKNVVLANPPSPPHRLPGKDCDRLVTFVLIPLITKVEFIFAIHHYGRHHGRKDFGCR